MNHALEFGIGWGNMADESFVHKLTTAVEDSNISYEEISFTNLSDLFERVEKKELHYRTFLDRGSTDNAAFFLMAERLQRQGSRVINDPRAIVRYSSKSNLVNLLSQHSLPMPEIIVFSSSRANSRDNKKMAVAAVEKLGVPFTLKLSYGGYEDDVQLNAHKPEDILNFLEEHSSEDILAQEYVVPRSILGKTAWFRIMHAIGKTIPLWWDPQNHFYQEFGDSSEEKEISKKIVAYTEDIAKLTGFELFSTEIAIDQNGEFKIIDYANQPIDLRSQDEAHDGLPVSVRNSIISQLVLCVKN